MMHLQAADFERFLAQGADALHRRHCRAERGDQRDAVDIRCTADCRAVLMRLPAQRCVDDQMEFARADRIHDMRRAVGDLVDRLDGQADHLQPFCRSRCANEREAEIVQVASNLRRRALVVIVDADQHRTSLWQWGVRRHFRLDEGVTEAAGVSHHFAC